MWTKIAAGFVHIITLGIYSGIKARRQAARDKAKREQDELIAAREKMKAQAKGASER